MVECASRDVDMGGGPGQRLLGVLLAALLVAACGAAATPSPVPATAVPTPTAAPTATLTPTLPPTAAPTTAASAAINPAALAALFAGKYTGTWRNTTFGSTGSAMVEVTVDQAARTMSARFTLGGNVFGRPAPSPETLTIPLASGATSTSTLFGPVSVTAVPEGTGYKVTFSAPNVPSTRIATFTATGTVTNPASIQLTYTVTFRDSTPAAQGTVALTRS
jgi:hypothetical protein